MAPCESRIRVLRAVTVNGVVQVGRRAARVAGVSDVPEHVAGLNDVALAEYAEAIEVRIVVPLESWPEDADNLAAEPIRTKACEDSARGADDRRAF